MTCGAPLAGRYCSKCGEKQVGPDDYSLRHFAEHSLDLLTHFDFKFFRSLWLLATRPGFLTERYLAGNRKPYLKPLQLFILINLVYFVSLYFYGANTFISPLSIHVGSDVYGGWAEDLVAGKLARSGESQADYARRFDARSAAAAKSLIFLIIPMYGALLGAVLFRCRRHVVEHLVFATHFMTWVLVFMLTAINLIVLVLAKMNALERFDAIGTWTLVGFMVLYFFLGLRRVYGIGPWFAAATALGLALSANLVITFYRFLLFVICYLAT